MQQGKKPNVGINGFGRMGFCALRHCIERKIPVVAINASRSPQELAYLFRFDSVHGRYDGKITCDEGFIIIDEQRIQITNEREPAKIPWGDLGAEYIIDCTGKFLTKKLASPHIEAGAKKVILSSPSKEGGDIPMFVYGVNSDLYEKNMRIVSNASCTTNCLAPLAKVINDNFGIDSGIMTTIHAQTSKQNTVDGYNAKDQRLGRSSLNIIPSSTGAAKAVGRVIPELNGKLTGMSMRIPVEDSSAVDLTVNLKKSTSYEEICNAMKKAAEHEMTGIVQYWEEAVVSADFIHDPCTCNFDAKAGIMLTPKFVKLIAWYDNEWAYMNQLINMLIHMHQIDSQ